MEKVTKMFLEHNKDIPIVKMKWLGANRKTATGHPDTWMFNQLTLEDGTVYQIPAVDSDKISGRTNIKGFNGQQATDRGGE
jgi:hypothetical protein